MVKKLPFCAQENVCGRLIFSHHHTQIKETKHLLKQVDSACLDLPFLHMANVFL